MERLNFKGFVEGLWMDDRKAKVGLSKIESPKPPAKMEEPKPTKRVVAKPRTPKLFWKSLGKGGQRRMPFPQ
jgi:hypothetical protein